MANVVAQPEVQNWLEPTKTEIRSDPSETIAHVQRRVFGQLSNAFEEVETWLGPSTTPDLVRDIIAMWTAGLIFNKFYAQQSTQFSGYGNMLISDAKSLLQGLIDGSIEIEEELTEKPKDLPAFWPTGGPTAPQPVFTMGGDL